MCLFSKLIKNKKYTETKKNGGIVPAVTDPRTLYVPIGCGKCIECRKQIANDWRTRLSEEIRTSTNGKFITLTFSNESIQELCELKELSTLKGYELDNKLATIAMRRFLERWRKAFSKSLRHWIVTELGHNGTENIHMHGIVWTNEKYSTIRDLWQYGYIWPRQDDIKTFVNDQTINYIVKYVHKLDEDHKEYKPKILSSNKPGIGHIYTEKTSSKRNKFNGTNTIETYKTPSGHEGRLPIYYRNKLYTDAEKETLWLQKLDKNERWICGDKINADDVDQYHKLLAYHRKNNTQLGYGDDSKNWERKEYEEKQRELLLWKRLNPNGYPKEWDE